MYEEDRKLLYKYLKKYYGQNKAQDLMINYSKHLFDFHGLAWSLGKRSLEFFCMYFLQDTFLPKPDNAARKLAPIHYEMWHEAENMFIKDEFDKLVMAEPRSCAKTTVFDTGVTIWLHSYEISYYTIVIGKVEQDSVEFISAVRHAFEENEYIEKAFGKLIDTKNNTVNKLEIELSNGTKVQALSSTSSIRGKKYGNHRPSVIISDDAQGQNDVITQEARDKKYNTWAQDTEYAGDKAVYRDGKKVKMATKFIILGTILHKDCFISRMLKNSQYRHILRRVVDFDVDDYFHNGLWEEFRKLYQNDKLLDPKAYALEFYYQHENEMKFKTIWEDKFKCIDLAIDYYTNPISFKQEMMNDASKIGEKWFKSISTQTVEEIENHNFVKTMIVADPANALNKRADYTSILIGSVADSGFRYIRKGILERFDFDSFCNKIIELLKENVDITHVDIEKNFYMGADVLKIKELMAKTPELINRNIIFVNNMARRNKDEKISTIIGAINNGQIIFNEEDKDFISQVKDFAGQDYSEHDDSVDTVAQFEIDVKEIKINQKIKLFDRRLLGL